MPEKIEFVSQLDPHASQLIFPQIGNKLSKLQVLQPNREKLQDNVEEHNISSPKNKDIDSEKLLTIYHAALKIKMDIKTSPPYTNCAEVNNQLAKRSFPKVYIYLCNHCCQRNHKKLIMFSMKLETEMNRT
jgi:hypothetical protein